MHTQTYIAQWTNKPTTFYKNNLQQRWEGGKEEEVNKGYIGGLGRQQQNSEYGKRKEKHILC